MEAQPSHGRRSPARPSTLRRVAAAALLALALGLLMPAAPARAISFTVSTTADSGGICRFADNACAAARSPAMPQRSSQK